MAKLINCSGEVKDITPKFGENFTLEELQECVGGLIEYIPIGGGKKLVANEEGKLLQLPVNATATSLVISAGINDIIVGSVVLLES